MKLASRRWTPDEKAELDRLLDAGTGHVKLRLQLLYRKGATEARLVEIGLKAKK
jgi:hypothetical protein